MTDWQDNRSMSPGEFKRSVRALGVSQSAAGRFFGISERTMRRLLNGEANIPVSVILLTRWMLEAGVAPKAPKRPRKPAVVADNLSTTST